MTAIGWVQIAVYAFLILLVTRPLGEYMFRVFEGDKRPLAPVFGPLERLSYRLCGVDETREQTWVEYSIALLVFSACGLIVTYAIQRLQGMLPFNPQGMAAVEPTSAFNTAASFTTNTNWQGYSGESTMSYLSQMAGLAWHNFTSAAAGMGVALALARGLTRKRGPDAPKTIGNFWVDLVRATLYVLLPICIVFTLVLVSQGVIQNLSAYADLTTLEGGQQTIALGPVASQEAIKQLGTNGGGFFNANAAHPFENPTPFTNLISLFLIFAIPAGLTYTYGRMAGDTKQGWAIFGAMSALFFFGLVVCYWAEAQGNPILSHLGIPQALGNMEGKEVRFGVGASTLYATVTTDASCGAVNAMHDSFTPLGGLVPLVNIQLGELIFGGVGAGLYGMIMMAVLTVFIAGLMVGRTPEYLGKKIQSREVRMAMLYVLIFPAVILVLTAAAAVLPAGLAGRNNAGPHGLSEILYAFSSVTGNNGSAFAGLSGGSSFYNTLLGLGTLFGRFAMMVPMLALAGFLAERKGVADSAGTFPVTTPLFVVLLVGVIVIVGALTFFPALSLGPVVEHLLMQAGRVF